ncbi:MAG: hypothetical protein HWN65_17625 [Candidatus Helarchaeota archaeon]|nr:hypothetical protein [Candidatus Helarchaeota archaeon]
MYIVVRIRYPNDLAPEVGKKYLEVMQKYPDDPALGEPTVLAAVRSTQRGITVISMSKVKKGKTDEALAYAWKRMVEFNDIKGFRYTVETWLEVTEALKLIGM